MSERISLFLVNKRENGKVFAYKLEFHSKLIISFKISWKFQSPSATKTIFSQIPARPARLS